MATIPDKLAAGDAITKAFLDAVVDALTDLNLATGEEAGLPNGSLDSDADADGLPDGWSRTLLQNGAGARETTAGNVSHGSAAYTFTRTSGASNGGGYLDSELFAVGPGSLELRWYYRATAALKSTVEVRWYDRAQAYLSSTTLATVTEASVRRGCMAAAEVPDTARYAKLRATGGTTDVDVAGAATFDGFQIALVPNSPFFTATGVVSFTGDGNWFTAQSVRVWIPSAATTLRATAKHRGTDGAYDSYFRVKVGAYTGSEIHEGGGSWNTAESSLTLDASLKGTYQDLELQFQGGSTHPCEYEIVTSTSKGFEGYIEIE